MKSITAFLGNPYLAMACRVFLGIVLIWAGWNKLADLEAFARNIHNFRMLPESTVNLVAIALPAIEILAGAGLILGLALKGSTLIATALFGMFFLAVQVAYLRGLDIECGCFGTSDASTVGIKMLWRNFGFLAATLPIWVCGQHRFAADSLFAGQNGETAPQNAAPEPSGT